MHALRWVGTTVAPIPSNISKVRAVTQEQDEGPNKADALSNIGSHLNREAPLPSCASCWAVFASKVMVIRSPVVENKAVAVMS